MTTVAAWESDVRSAQADIRRRRSKPKPKTENVWVLFTRLRDPKTLKPTTKWYLMAVRLTKRDIRNVIENESWRDDGRARQLRIVKTTVVVPED